MGDFYGLGEVVGFGAVGTGEVDGLGDVPGRLSEPVGVAGTGEPEGARVTGATSIILLTDGR